LNRRFKAALIAALAAVALAAAIFVVDPLAFYRMRVPPGGASTPLEENTSNSLPPMEFYSMQVPPGCIGILFEDSALNRLPPNASKAIVDLFISSPVGDLTERVTAVVSRGSRAFYKLCLSIDLSEAEGKFKEYVDRMKALTNLSEPPVALPTLNIVAYAYSDGRKYVASEMYSTATSRDPFALLRGSHIVVVRDLKFSALP